MPLSKPWQSAIPTPYVKPSWALTPEQERAYNEQWMRENEPRLNILMEAYKGAYGNVLNKARAGDPSYSYILDREQTGAPWWQYFVPPALLGGFSDKEPGAWSQYLKLAPLYTPGPNPYGIENPNPRPEMPSGYESWRW